MSSKHSLANRASPLIPQNPSFRWYLPPAATLMKGQLNAPRDKKNPHQPLEGVVLWMPCFSRSLRTMAVKVLIASYISVTLVSSCPHWQALEPLPCTRADAFSWYCVGTRFNGCIRRRGSLSWSRVGFASAPSGGGRRNRFTISITPAMALHNPKMIQSPSTLKQPEKVNQLGWESLHPNWPLAIDWKRDDHRR